MTKIKYNDFDIKKLSLGKAIPIKSENKITGYFIPIHGPKTVGTKVDSVFFQTPLLNTKFEKAKYSDKNTQMILSISNIEALVCSLASAINPYEARSVLGSVVPLREGEYFIPGSWPDRDGALRYINELLAIEEVMES